MALPSQSDVIATFGLDLTPAERQINNFARSIKPIRAQVNLPLGQISRDANDFTRSVAAAQSRVLAFSATASQVYLVARGFQAMLKAIVDVEKQLTDINVVFGLSSKQLTSFANDLFRAANLTGQSFETASKAALEFSRQGLSVEETIKRTTDALTLVRFSGLDAGKAVESLTAVLNGFNTSGLDSTKVINKLISVDQNFAISAGGLAEALSRTSAVAKDSGVQFDELLGIITAAKQITGRDAPVIGNALKTIFQRVQRPEVMNNLKELGVLTEDYNGEALSSLQILTNLAQKYDGLSTSQRNAITQLGAGVFQANQFKAILSDLAKQNSISARATDVAANASDQASRRQIELNKTLSASINETINNLTQMASKAGKIVIEPAARNVLGIINLITEKTKGGEKGQEAGTSVGTNIGVGILKGLGNYLSGPGLALIATMIVRFGGQFASFAGKSLAGIIEESGKRYALEQATTALLQRQPQLMSEIVRLGGDQAKIQALVTQELQKELVLLNEIATVNAKITGAITNKSMGIPLTSQRAFTLNPRGDIAVNPRYQPKTKAVGLIPTIQETIGAYEGGYTPGQIKEMMVPQLGKVVYNSAETVKQFPGMSQPAIMPPMSSKAGQNYQEQFKATHGFNPYAAGGMVPNFANLIIPSQQEYLHRTYPEFYQDILKNGFSLKNFGHTGKKYNVPNDSSLIKYDPAGIFAQDLHPTSNLTSTEYAKFLAFRNTGRNNIFKIKNYDSNYTVKGQISKQFGGKTGFDLREALLREGFDSVDAMGEKIFLRPENLKILRTLSSGFSPYANKGFLPNFAADFIGSTYGGRVMGRRVDNARIALHNEHGMISGANSSNWRYIGDKNQILWNTQPTQEDKFKAEDFLARQGISNANHKNMYSFGNKGIIPNFANPLQMGLRKAGLPLDIQFGKYDNAIREALVEGKWNLNAIKDEQSFYPKYDVGIEPPLSSNIIKVPSNLYKGQPGRRNMFVDKRFAGIRPDYVDEERELVYNRPYLRENSRLSENIPFNQEEGFIYRGLNFVEMQNIRKTKIIRSAGKYNLGDEQSGLTFFSTDPRQAGNYAGNFAPWQHVPTFERPSYIIKVRGKGEIPSGMGSDTTERAIRGAMHANQIEDIAVVRPYAIGSGNLALIQERGLGAMTEGSRGSPSAFIGYKKLGKPSFAPGFLPYANKGLVPNFAYIPGVTPLVGRLLTNLVEPRGYDLGSKLQKLKNVGLKDIFNAVVKDKRYEPAFDSGWDREESSYLLNFGFRKLFGLKSQYPEEIKSLLDARGGGKYSFTKESQSYKHVERYVRMLKMNSPKVINRSETEKSYLGTSHPVMGRYIINRSLQSGKYSYNDNFDLGLLRDEPIGIKEAIRDLKKIPRLLKEQKYRREQARVFQRSLGQDFKVKPPGLLRSLFGAFADSSIQHYPPASTSSQENPNIYGSLGLSNVARYLVNKITAKPVNFSGTLDYSSGFLPYANKGLVPNYATQLGLFGHQVKPTLESYNYSDNYYKAFRQSLGDKALVSMMNRNIKASYEKNPSQNFLISKAPSSAAPYGFWISPKGEMHIVNDKASHEDKLKEIMKAMGKPVPSPSYSDLMNLGWYRGYVNKAYGSVQVNTYNSDFKLTTSQIRAIKDFASTYGYGATNVSTRDRFETLLHTPEDYKYENDYLSNKGLVPNYAATDNIRLGGSRVWAKGMVPNFVNLGDRVKLIANAIAKNERVSAVRVSSPEVQSQNDTPHITLGVNREAGGKPFHSNELKEWQDIAPIELEGVLSQGKGYHGAFLTPESRERLLKHVGGSGMPETIAHHMTVGLGDFKANKGLVPNFAGRGTTGRLAGGRISFNPNSERDFLDRSMRRIKVLNKNNIPYTFTPNWDTYHNPKLRYELKWGDKLDSDDRNLIQFSSKSGLAKFHEKNLEHSITLWEHSRNNYSSGFSPYTNKGLVPNFIPQNFQPNISLGKQIGLGASKNIYEVSEIQRDLFKSNTLNPQEIVAGILRHGNIKDFVKQQRLFELGAPVPQIFGFEDIVLPTPPMSSSYESVRNWVPKIKNAALIDKMQTFDTGDLRDIARTSGLNEVNVHQNLGNVLTQYLKQKGYIDSFRTAHGINFGDVKGDLRLDNLGVRRGFSKSVARDELATIAQVTSEIGAGDIRYIDNIVENAGLTVLDSGYLRPRKSSNGLVPNYAGIRYDEILKFIQQARASNQLFSLKFKKSDGTIRATGQAGFFGGNAKFERERGAKGEFFGKEVPYDEKRLPFIDMEIYKQKIQEGMAEKEAKKAAYRSATFKNILQINGEDIVKNQGLVPNFGVREFIPAWKDRKFKNLRYALLPDVDNPESMYLANLESFDRGKGNASRFMKQLGRVADKTNTPVSLIASASNAPGALSQEALEKFYTKHGFQPLAGFEELQAMTRLPKKASGLVPNFAPKLSYGAKPALNPTPEPLPYGFWINPSGTMTPVPHIGHRPRGEEILKKIEPNILNSPDFKGVRQELWNRGYYRAVIEDNALRLEGGNARQPIPSYILRSAKNYAIENKLKLIDDTPEFGVSTVLYHPNREFSKGLVPNYFNPKDKVLSFLSKVNPEYITSFRNIQNRDTGLAKFIRNSADLRGEKGLQEMGTMLNKQFIQITPSKYGLGTTGNVNLQDTPENIRAGINEMFGRFNVQSPLTSKGLVPNYAVSLKSRMNPYTKTPMMDRFILETESGSALTFNKRQNSPGLDIGNVESKKKGDGYELFKILADLAKSYKVPILSSSLIPQGDRLKPGMDEIQRLYALFPQLRWRKGMKEVSGKYASKRTGLTLQFSSLDELEKQIKENLIVPHPQDDIYSVKTLVSKGLVPNFSALSDAIVRENEAGIPLSQIKVGESPSLVSNLNPNGLGVYNTIDEPMGLNQGITRAMNMGLNPKTHGVPNFAEYRRKIDSPFKDIYPRPTEPKLEGRLIEGKELDDLNRSIKKFKDAVKSGAIRADNFAKSLEEFAKETKLVDDSLKTIRTTILEPSLKSKQATINRPNLNVWQTAGTRYPGYMGYNETSPEGIARARSQVLPPYQAPVQGLAAQSYRQYVLSKAKESFNDNYFRGAKLLESPIAGERPTLLREQPEFENMRARGMVNKEIDTYLDLLSQGAKRSSREMIQFEEAIHSHVKALSHPEELERNQAKLTQVLKGESAGLAEQIGAKASLENKARNLLRKRVVNLEKLDVSTLAELNTPKSKIGTAGYAKEAQKSYQQFLNTTGYREDRKKISQLPSDERGEATRLVNQRYQQLFKQRGVAQVEQSLGKLNLLDYTAGAFIPGSRYRRTIASATALGGAQQIRNNKQQMAGAAMGVGFILPMLTGAAEQQIGTTFGETTGGRGAARTIGALGQVGSYALTGLALGGGNPLGALGGAAFGTLVELPSVIKSFTDTLPDLERNLEKVKEASQKTTVSLQSYAQANEALGDTPVRSNLRPSQIRLLEAQRASALANLSPSVKRQLLQANKSGNRDIYGILDIAQATAGQNVNLASDISSFRASIQEKLPSGTYTIRNAMNQFKGAYQSGLLGVATGGGAIKDTYDYIKQGDFRSAFKNISSFGTKSLSDASVLSAQIVRDLEEKDFEEVGKRADPLVTGILSATNREGKSLYQTISNRDIEEIQALGKTGDSEKLRGIISKLTSRGGFDKTTIGQIEKVFDSAKDTRGAGVLTRAFARNTSKQEIYGMRETIRLQDEAAHEMSMIFKTIERTLSSFNNASAKFVTKFETESIKRFANLTNKVALSDIGRAGAIGRQAILAGDSPKLRRALEYRKTSGDIDSESKKAEYQLQEEVEGRAVNIIKETYDTMVEDMAKNAATSRILGGDAGSINKRFESAIGRIGRSGIVDITTEKTKAGLDVKDIQLKSGVNLGGNEIDELIKIFQDLGQATSALSELPQPRVDDIVGLLQDKTLKGDVESRLTLPKPAFKYSTTSGRETATLNANYSDDQVQYARQERILALFQISPEIAGRLKKALTEDQVRQEALDLKDAATQASLSRKASQGLLLLKGSLNKQRATNITRTSNLNQQSLKQYLEDQETISTELGKNTSNLLFNSILDLEKTRDDIKTARLTERARPLEAINIQYNKQAKDFARGETVKINERFNKKYSPEDIASGKALKAAQAPIESLQARVTEQEMLDKTGEGNLDNLQKANEELEEAVDLAEALRDVGITINSNTAQQNELKERANELAKRDLKFTENKLNLTRSLNRLSASEGGRGALGSMKNLGQTLIEPLQTSREQFFADMSDDLQDFSKEFKTSFRDGFKEAIMNGKDFGDSMRDVFTSLSDSLLSKGIDRSTDILFGSLFGSGQEGSSGKDNQGYFGGGKDGILGSLFSAIMPKKADGGYIAKYAKGGYVNMGSGTKDDVPALLSGGEFVLNKRAVQRIGKQNLDRLNNSPISKRSRMKMYAAGGSFYNPAQDEWSGAISSDTISMSPRSANIGLANTFEINAAGTKGWFNTSPLLSVAGASDPNNPQNALKWKREQWMGEKYAYDRINKEKVKQFNDAKRSKAIGSFITAAITIAGEYGRGGNKPGTQSPMDQFMKGTYGGSANTPLTDMEMGKSLPTFQGYNTPSPIYMGRANGGMIPKYANGGMFGAESSSDRYPAMIMGGEYVINPKTVSAYGANYFNSLNKGYAGGGYVNPSAPSEVNFNDSFEKLIAVSEQIRDNLGGNKPTENKGTSEGGTTNTVSINITMAANGTTTSNTTATTENKGENKSNTNKEDAIKLGKTLEGVVLQVLQKESKPNGFLSDKFASKKT